MCTIDDVLVPDGKAPRNEEIRYDGGGGKQEGWANYKRLVFQRCPAHHLGMKN